MGIVHPDVVRAEGAAIAERLAEEDRLIEAFGLADLLPEFPQDDNYQAWQEWHRQMGRGPVTTAGMLEAYRRGYRAARLEGIRMGLKAAAKVAVEKVEKRIGVPCPDGVEGCLAFHFRREYRDKSAPHIAHEIRALSPDTIAKEAE